MDSTKKYLVKNRSAGMVVYRIPEAGIRREFMPGESKKVDFDELEKLAYQPGGRELMAEYLIVNAEEALEELGIHREPEYWMNEQNVITLLQSGSLDEFLDCLDFAPAGVMDLIQKYAVSLPLNDFNKRKALKDKTGFDVDAALKNMMAEKEDEGGKIEPNKERRVKPATATPGRRTDGGKYKVVNTGAPEGITTEETQSVE